MDSGNWTDTVRRVKLCVNRHTQLAINASADDSPKGWRQWAQEACAGSAGAGHGRPRASHQADGDVAADVAGWATGVKQLADQACWGGPMAVFRSPRQCLEDIQRYCRPWTRQCQPQGHFGSCRATCGRSRQVAGRSAGRTPLAALQQCSTTVTRRPSAACYSSCCHGSMKANRRATSAPISSWAGGGERRSSRVAWQGVPKGRGARDYSERLDKHSQPYHLWLQGQGFVGLQSFKRHPDTGQSNQIRRCQSRLPPQPRAEGGFHDAGPNAQATEAKNVDPPFRHHRQVVLAWAMGVWEGVPDLNTLQAALRRAIARSTSWGVRRRLWASGSTRQPWCGQTVQHTGRTHKARFSGRESDPCWLLGGWRDGPFGTEMCLSSWFPRLGRQPLPALPRRARHDVSPLLRVPSNAGRAGRLLEPQRREQFVRGCFPCPAPILPMEARQQSLWHSRPPDGLLEGHIFTEGSSGSGLVGLWWRWTIWRTSSLPRAGLC